jgi:hypothetical protein
MKYKTIIKIQGKTLFEIIYQIGVYHAKKQYNRKRRADRLRLWRMEHFLCKCSNGRLAAFGKDWVFRKGLPRFNRVVMVDCNGVLR